MNTKKYHIGTVAGLVITGDTSAIIGSLFLYVVLVAVGTVLLDLSIGTAFLLAIIATLFHLLVSYLHHLGHSLAARRTGYPMRGLHYHTLLARSIYPKDEPELAPRIHIQRALGGPLMSVGVAVISLGLVLLAKDSFMYYPLVFFAFDSFFIYTLGALTPLGFTDGSTILYWRRKDNK